MNKNKTFILPKNWHIIVTEENAEDVLKWRFDKDNEELNKLNYYLDKIVGVYKEGNIIEKGHNPKDCIKTDTYDFGIEITYTQFKKYVLNKQKEDYSYLIKLFKQLNIK
jgi:hypothetical protein